MLNKVKQPLNNFGEQVNDFGEVVKQARHRCGESASALARKWGTSPTSVTRWENGESTPSTADLKRILPRMDLAAQTGTLAWLLSGTRLSLSVRECPSDEPEGDMVDATLKAMAKGNLFASAVKVAEDDGIITPGEACNLLALIAPIQSHYDRIGVRIQEASRNGRPTRRLGMLEVIGAVS